MRKPHWGRDEETPSSCSRFRHQRLRNSRYKLQILDTRMGLLIIIVLPATCLVEKLSCTHMIYRIYHNITEVTRESHLSGVTMICKPRRGFSSRGCCKPWEREWDSIVLSAMWRLIISPTSLILFFYKKPDFNEVLVLQSTTPWYSFLWLYHAICPHVAGGTRESEQVSKIYKPRRGLPSCGCCKSWARGSYMQVVGTTCVHFSRIQWYCKSFKNMIE